MNCMKKLVFILICSIPMVSMAQDRITGKAFATRSEVVAQNGMVATSHPLATQVGLDILKKGGTAIDAAIAANATLGLMEPTGCGIGGDLFAIVWDAKTQQLYGLNASGRSPQQMTLAQLKEKGNGRIPAYGPLPVSVPGAVDGWFALHGKFGQLSMQEILAPAISYAEQGYPVSELIAFYLQGNLRNYLKRDFPNVADTYLIDGELPQKGDLFKNPYLADTYRKIAEGGRDAFYTGAIAKTTVKFLQEQGGMMTLEDFAQHTSEWIEPVSTNYRGYDVWELPPNGQGIAALQMLNIIEGYDFTDISFGSTEHIHLVTEAKKLAFEDRAKYYADMEFANVPVQQLISKAYGTSRKALIDESRANQFSAGDISEGETIYLTVADQYGNMVSYIQSNYMGMGSGMIPPKLGFTLQNRGRLFSLEEGDLNVYEPNKRPFHTIIPAFVTKDGQPFMSFGVMGGDFQPQGHTQIIMNMIDFGMNLQEAGDAPRMRHVGSSSPTGYQARGSGTIQLENGFDYEVIRGLLQMGHDVGFNSGGYGGYQAIMWDPVKKVYFGASESRKDGQAAGY